MVYAHVSSLRIDQHRKRHAEGPGTGRSEVIEPHRVAELWAVMRAVAAEHVADVERLATAYLGDRGQLQTVTRAELKRRLRSRDVIVLDVRPTAEYQAGHIAGAISVPIDVLPHKIGDLPPDAGVVAYCRGPYCVYADQAVRTLTKRGRRAARLEDGYPEWARAGLPVGKGAYSLVPSIK
jgi:rhodanese-related sulfurtransferase